MQQKRLYGCQRDPKRKQNIIILIYISTLTTFIFTRKAIFIQFVQENVKKLIISR